MPDARRKTGKHNRVRKEGAESLISSKLGFVDESVPEIQRSAIKNFQRYSIKVKDVQERPGKNEIASSTMHLICVPLLGY